MPIFALSLLWKKKVLYILYLNPKFIRNSLFDYNTYIKVISYFPMFPLAFKKHSAQVSFAGTPLQLQPWQKQSDCIIIIVIWYVSLFSACYYDWLCFSSVLTKWNTPLLSIFNHAQLVLKKIILFIFKIICRIPKHHTPFMPLNKKGK